MDEEKVFKPTLREPMSDQSTKFTKDFKKEMIKHNQMDIATQIKEADGLLTEKEQSLKKKIFSLPKMEALVFGDPKLSAIYDDMAENGEEKYGYHYNETIMNMIFNDYVLNSQKYLAKYKMAIPKEKKRRDKSGINQLKKASKPEYERTAKIEKPKTEKKPEKPKEMPTTTIPTEKNIEETTGTGVAGGGSFSGQANGSTKASYSYSQPAIWSKSGKPERHKKPFYPKGEVVTEDNYLVESKMFEDMFNELNEQEMGNPISNTYGDISNMSPEDQNIIRKDAQTGVMDRELSEPISEKAISKSQQKFMGMVHAVQKGELDPDKVGGDVAKAAKTMKKSDAEDFASTKHKGLPEKVKPKKKVNENPALAALAEPAIMAAATGAGQSIGNRVADKVGLEENNITQETQDSMIQSSEESMKNKPQPEGEISSGGNVPTGTNIGGGMMSESDIKLLEQLSEELEAFSIHHDKLKKIAEDRKPSALVLRDRLGAQNEKNFKKDLSHSGTKDIVDIQKELQWKDQQTDVGNDPQKLGADIEKSVIKATGGEALKNVGDSANLKGDEIPKRNLTKPEQEEIDKMRLGMEDLVYDNEPNEKFEKRIETEMGEELYKQGQESKKYRAKAPTYNKDTQPVEDGEDKVQYDKEKSGWADRYGLKETYVSGRFNNLLGKSQVISFRLNEVLEIIDKEALQYLAEVDFKGFGNTYSNRGTLNEDFVNASKEYKFYTDGKAVLVFKTPVQKLNETVQTKQKLVVNEDVEKIKKLSGYKPSDYVKTDNVKKNRGF